jgi:hypothetical protein
MRQTIEQGRSVGFAGDPSRFLFGYLLALFSALLLIHLLQPQGGGSLSSSRSPAHQERLLPR